MMSTGSNPRLGAWRDTPAGGGSAVKTTVAPGWF